MERKSNHLSSINKAIIVLLMAVLGMGGLLLWKKKYGHRKIVLNKDDMKILVASQGPQLQGALAASPEQRKKFAENLKEMLAISLEAEDAGLANDLETKRTLDLQRTSVLAQLYLKQQQKDNPQASLFTIVKKEEVDAYFQNKNNQARFDRFIAEVLEKNPAAKEQLTEERKADLKQRYGQTFLAAERAAAGGLDQSREAQLQLMLQRANVLAQKYAQENIVEKAKSQATDKAIDEYIAKHPELDENKMREKAEGLLKRVRAGEDFVKLADEFTDEPGGKGKGGDLGWFTRGRMVPEFEEAAFKLQPGQVSEVIKTQFGFHIIKVEGRRMSSGDGKDKDETQEAHAAPQADKKVPPKAQPKPAAKPKADAPPDINLGGPPAPAKPTGPQEEVHARHILIKVGGDASPLGGPAGSPREQAKAAVEEEKQQQIVDEIVKNAHVEIAEDFEVEPPADGGFPPGLGGPGGPPPPQPQAPPSGAKPKPAAPPQPKKK
jgi:peptidyl-prolyl cis-trans isomerase C